MVDSKVYIEIRYPMNGTSPKIKTNVKTELVDDYLADYVRSVSGAGKDERKPNEREVYNVRFECDLSDDTFSTRSDTGNKGLTAGIVMDTIGKWDKAER